MTDQGNAAEVRGLPPLDTEGVLWAAALVLVPIEERIDWVAKMKARVDEINAARAAYEGTRMPLASVAGAS